MSPIIEVTQVRLRLGCGKRAEGRLEFPIYSRFFITNEICQNP